MDDGQLVAFGSLGISAPFVLRMATTCTSGEYRLMAAQGASVNAEQFREYGPGELLLSSMRRHLDGSVSATLTPLPHKAPDHVRRASFSEMFIESP